MIEHAAVNYYQPIERSATISMFCHDHFDQTFKYIFSIVLIIYE